MKLKTCIFLLRYSLHTYTSEISRFNRPFQFFAYKLVLKVSLEVNESQNPLETNKGWYNKNSLLGISLQFRVLHITFWLIESKALSKSTNKLCITLIAIYKPVGMKVCYTSIVFADCLIPSVMRSFGQMVPSSNLFCLTK